MSNFISCETTAVRREDGKARKLFSNRDMKMRPDLTHAVTKDSFPRSVGVNFDTKASHGHGWWTVFFRRSLQAETIKQRLKLVKSIERSIGGVPRRRNRLNKRLPCNHVA